MQNTEPNSQNANLLNKFRALFTTRDFIFHDGRALRRFSVGGKTQAMGAGIAALTLCFSAYGVGQVAVGAASASGVVEAPASEQRLAEMQAQVEAMQADVARVRQAAALHAARVEQRQALITAALSGKGDPADIDLAAITGDAAISGTAASALEPWLRVEARQMAMAERAQRAAEQRYAMTKAQIRKLGLSPDRYSRGGMGGPLEPVGNDREDGATTAAAAADDQFRSLFQSWKRLDSLESAVISIPSLQPVAEMRLTSSFGVRSDPFRGTAAMHAGLDIPGPVGTPIYATADGIVSRSQRAGAYGLLVEVNHGKGIQTRYAHLSKLLVQPNTRVRRGQIIGLMGSTGRSTGSHLHYEVRVDGRAVNPMPFIQAGDALLAAQDRAAKTREAAGMGGPAN